MTTKAHARVIRQSNDLFIPVAPDNSPEHDKLPVGTYLVKVGPPGFYCERVENMTLPKKLYGSLTKRAARIIRTFLHRPGNTGVNLTGMKGAGKSLLIKAISKLLLDKGFPTIIVNQAFAGDEFAQFLSSLNTPCVILLDEFEKVYDAEDQEKLLTLLDGVFQQKNLFLLTCNKQEKVDQNMVNRPSRIFYSIHYKGMEVEAIRELAQDTLIDKSKVDDVVKLSSLFNDEMNFDMVQSAIEEVNRYPDEPLSELMAMMNLRPTSLASQHTYKVRIEYEGKQYAQEAVYPKQSYLGIFNFSGCEFFIRDGFSNEEMVQEGEEEKRPGRPAPSAPATIKTSGGAVADFEKLHDEVNKKVKKQLKKAAEAAAALAKDESPEAARERKYDQNRTKLGKEYEDVWDEWTSDYRFAGLKRNLRMFEFSHKQMIGSDPKKGAYSFKNEDGAVLTLTRVIQESFNTEDFYKML